MDNKQIAKELVRLAKKIRTRSTEDIYRDYEKIYFSHLKSAAKFLSNAVLDILESQEMVVNVGNKSLLKVLEQFEGNLVDQQKNLAKIQALSFLRES